MISVILIGTGNVAHHFIKAFYKSNKVNLVQVYGRNQEALESIPFSVPTTNNLKLLADADVFLMAISDDAIKELTRNFPFKNKLLVHTSGTQPLESVQNTNRKGVFYPLQTFSKNKSVNFSDIPICIEANNTADERLLMHLAKSISNTVHIVDSAKRKYLHLAAVFANNFTNYCYALANEICNENQLDFKMLLPLIQETAQKVTNLSPLAAQTGPARRNDKKTIAAHLNLLDSDKKEIYKQLTKAIQYTYGKKL
ncbi:MAG: hypothetical protein CSA39_02015 [Flavobacteriales bacterium]|nr:MAG: hypothetical protein CSA39_02015 [Flavobacteriales bacterium]